MSFERKDLNGALFLNDKRDRDTHPHYKGNATIRGEEFWMDAWINEDKNGKKYLAVKFKAKETAPLQPADFYKDLDDDVPF